MVSRIEPQKAVSNLERAQNTAINQIAVEIWHHIFSFLSRDQWMNVVLSHRKWNIALRQDIFWKNLFKRTVLYTNTFTFISWKKAVLNYYHEKDRTAPVCSQKQLARVSHLNRVIKRLDAPIFYRAEGLEFCGFVDTSRVLVKITNTLKILRLEATQITEEFSHPYEGGFKAQLGRLQAFSNSGTVDQPPSVIHLRTYHQRFLVILRSDGSIESIDFTGTKSSIALKPQDKFDSNSVKPMGDNSIVLVTEKQQIFSYHLGTGKSQLLSNKKVFEWKGISNTLLLLVFEDGSVQVLNLADGVQAPISTPIEDCKMYRAIIGIGAVILFYYSQRHRGCVTKLINLETGQSFISKKRKDGLGLETTFCAFLEKSKQLFLCYPQQLSDYEFEFFYEVVNFESGNSALQFHLLTCCNPLIMCSDDYLLYMGGRGAIYAYNVKSKKEILLVDSISVEKRTFLEKQVFENKIFIWTEAEWDDYSYEGKTHSIECNIFDPLNFSVSKPTPQSVYTNEQNYFLVSSKGSFVLFNKRTLSTVLSSHSFDELFLFYDKTKNKAVIGTNLKREYEDYEEEKFSLEVCNLDKGIFSNIVTDERGCLSAIYDTGSAIQAFITESFQQARLLEITDNGAKWTSLEAGTTSANFMKGKLLLNSGGAICILNTENFKFDSALAYPQEFELTRNFVVVKSKDTLEFFRIPNNS